MISRTVKLLRDIIFEQVSEFLQGPMYVLQSVQHAYYTLSDLSSVAQHSNRLRNTRDLVIGA